MGKLEGKTALITGASRGIGRGIALELAREGAHVAVNYREHAAAAADTVLAIERLGSQAFAIQADVGDWAAVRGMADAVLAYFGHLDIVVANSGVASRALPLWKIAVDHWLHVVNVNLNGVFFTCRATVGHLVARRSGCVILISSAGADLCRANAGPYAAAKAGVNALTKCLARECAPAGVRANCIAPGFIVTDMVQPVIERRSEAEITEEIPLGRSGQPEEIGKAAVFLASEDAGFITGKVLHVDGGAWM